MKNKFFYIWKKLISSPFCFNLKKERKPTCNLFPPCFLSFVYLLGVPSGKRSYHPVFESDTDSAFIWQCTWEGQVGYRYRYGEGWLRVV